MNPPTSFRLRTAFYTLLLCLSAHGNGLGTSFNWQGRLNDNGAPANGTYDFRFALCDAASDGNQIGTTLSKPATKVSGGLFTASLDFGADAFDGNARWLEVGVRTNGSSSSFVTLSPRHRLAPVPYALYASNAATAVTAVMATTATTVANNAVSETGIASGQVVKSLNGLHDAVMLKAGANMSLTTDGSTLTLSASGGGASGGWSTTGNSGTKPSANFLGTTDGQPLVLKAGNVGINTNKPQAALHVNGTVLASGFSGDGSALTGVTLAAPFTLKQLGASNDLGYALGVAVSGRYAYLAAAADGGFLVYDVSDPTHPQRVAQNKDLPWDPHAVAISGHYAFVAAGSLCAVDISIPANPVTVYDGGNKYYTWGVTVSDNLAYLAAGQDGLFLYNIAAPTKPVAVAHVNNGGQAYAVAVSGGFAYLANEIDGLRIYNVSNPAKPVNVGHITEANTDSGAALGVAVSGAYAYVANDADGVRIYDVTNPAKPVSVGHIPADSGDSAYSVTLSGRFAFVANTRGLHGYDISNPANPVEVGVVEPADSGAVKAVAVQGNYAYVANDNGGLSICFAAPLAQVPGAISATSFLGDGSALTNLTAGHLTGQLPSSVANNLWQVGGNAGTAPGQNFLGTTDNEPLEFWVNDARALRLEPGANGAPNVIGGSPYNYVRKGAVGATIGGGGSIDYLGLSPATNSVIDDFGTVGGGRLNRAYFAATVGGGEENTAGGMDSTVSGGAYNTARDGSTTVGGGENNTAGALDSTVSGGAHNTASGAGATVSGGLTNSAGGVWATVTGGNGNEASAKGSTVGGGLQNAASGSYSVVGGGGLNVSSAHIATVAGGDSNTASGENATVGGGHNNAASNWYATVPGGAWNVAKGQGSFAAGRAATADHDGAFVWSDGGQDGSTELHSSAANQFAARCSGGVIFYSDLGSSAGVRLAPGGNAWSNLSDRNQKTNFVEVDARSLLERLATMPISTWNLKTQDPSVRHIGPMAQDFKAAFGLGEDDRHISTSDSEGVALAAVKGLNQKLEDELKRRDAENAELKARLELLERRLNQLHGGAH